MQYPLITEYIEAIQYSESFESADLQALRPVLDANGRPMMTSGNFAVVFKMQNQQTGAEYALKCFTQDQEGRAEAYRQIMAELRYVDSPYFIDLEYIEEAVWAGDFDCAFPAVLMPWVDGEPLDQHIRRLVSEEPDRLQLVAYKFSVMASWLVNQPFAHGDLKPDNILVRQDGSMVLVDYDGIYVPSMRGMTMREAGTPAFRHPNRVNMAFDEYIDDFALATINLSLYLIALKPSLLQTHGAKDRLLFSDDDYRNIASRIIGEISQLSYDTQLQRLYACFLIALSAGNLQGCEKSFLLLSPPQIDFHVEQVKHPSLPQPKNSHSKDLIFNVNGVQFKMVYVDGGSFMMGGATSEQGNVVYNDEKPVHKVTLDDYYIAETQVTQALWKAVVGKNPSVFKGDDNPVDSILWDDCQEFIRKLNQLTGQTFALPTEAQWEFAARGGKLSKGYKYAGSDNIYEVAWFDDNSNSQTHPVAQKKPNELGLYDMSGNVWEWCNDWYGSNYYQLSPQYNPEGTSCGIEHVLRGGCFGFYDDYCRVSARGDDYFGGFRKEFRGMRLSLSCKKDKTFAVNGVQFKMVYVEGGTFMMGATAEQGDDAFDSEKPQHKVTLDDYYIAETQVTQALWQAVMGVSIQEQSQKGSWTKDLKGVGDNNPMYYISWDDCQEFVRKLNQLTGQTFALPTEAQWEFAARGGKLSKGYKYAGSDNLNEVAWFGDKSNSQTHPVAQKKPNELGLYDMSGNVWEWCNDCYNSNYYQSSSERNPQGPTSGDFRVVRGGGWCLVARRCRVSYRSYSNPVRRFNVIGMRLSLSLQPSDLVFDVNGVQFKMKYVEGGEFMMGATAEQGDDARDNEKPAHKVLLDSYYIGETQVTQALWEAVMGVSIQEQSKSLSKKLRGVGENNPMYYISWDDCIEFVKRINQLTGKQFRLPTEAEWEYAARGGSLSRGYKYAGGNTLDDVAWFGDNSGKITHPVAQKKANELGIYDMSGNVWEWCEVWHDGVNYDDCRVLRGGCCYTIASLCQVSNRKCRPLDRIFYYFGVRLSLSVDNSGQIDNLLDYSIGKWLVKSSRKFNDAEINSVSSAVVVSSKYGNSVCFFMKSGDRAYIPLSSDSTKSVGEAINLAECEVITLAKSSECDIIRIKA